MKKLYLLITALCFFNGLNAQIIVIPSYFKSKLLTSSSTNTMAKNLAGNYFKIDANDDKEIQVSEALMVSYLNLNYSQLYSLEGISNFTNLQTLFCANNNLRDIDLTGLINLEYLICKNNSIGGSVDFSGLPNLVNLSCNNNQISRLFIKNGKDEILDFSGNPFLRYICADESQIFQIKLQAITNNNNNCNINSYCTFTPGGTTFNIQGYGKYDYDNNGCDLLDVSTSNLKFNITINSVAGSIISNSSGVFSMYVKEGTNTITPIIENPTYFNVSPTSVNVTFPTQTSPFTQNFCITPNGVRPDLEVTLIPLRPARPGFDAKYKIVYKNKGNTTQSGSVNLNFLDAVLDLVVANPVASTNSTNTLSWDFTNLKPFETREITFTMNVNSPMEIPAVNIADVLNFTTSFTSVATDETPADNAFTLNQIVVGSFDPNDKTCLEGTVITPDLIGEYVHYLIRFENTGTFAAQNIVVKDMIDLSKFDISTLVPTSASHSFVTNITAGNKVEFIFENINLPFDDTNNDGYIAFKIKTLPTLVVNDSFTNEANIYFDYNFPILTNKATSTFKTLGTQDFDFAKYFTVYPNPAKADLNITAKETINVKSISVYNTLGQLVLVVTNADKVSKIDVSRLTAGNYFVQIKADKGTSNARFIKE